MPQDKTTHKNSSFVLDMSLNLSFWSGPSFSGPCLARPHLHLNIITENLISSNKLRKQIYIVYIAVKSILLAWSHEAMSKPICSFFIRQKFVC